MYKKILKNIKINSKKIFYFSNELEILKFLDKIILKNDIILAKGSNSSKVNKLVKKLFDKQRKK